MLPKKHLCGNEKEIRENVINRLFTNLLFPPIHFKCPIYFMHSIQCTYLILKISSYV